MHSKNEALMCKVFQSSLGPVAMRWFDGLSAGSIYSFKEITRVFGSHIITCSKVPWPLDSLLSMSMQERETLKTYSDRYWEMFSEIDGDFDDVAIRTFNIVLPAEHDLRKSLTKKLDKYNNNKPQRDFAGQSRFATSQVVNTVFREPVHQVLEKIKNEPYFKWPNKMGGDEAQPMSLLPVPSRTKAYH